MPSRPASPCRYCGRLMPCSAHPNQGAFSTAKRAGETLYTKRWQIESKAFVSGRLCPCGAPATQTDHEPPHRGDVDMFWDRSTWHPICARCHNSKTSHEVNERRRTGIA